jgi:arginyl-tRNA synthetase
MIEVQVREVLGHILTTTFPEAAGAEIAADLAAALQGREDLFAAVEVAGPGFINFRIAPAVLQAGLAEILEAGEKWGTSTSGAGEPVQVEFVSANPTGPLNVVSARAAAYGSTLTRLLRAAGYDARSEFYVNDVGRQIDLFGASLIARWHELQGKGPAVIPEDGYQGEYMAALAAKLAVGEAEEALSAPEDRDRWVAMGRLGVAHMLEQQEADLKAYGTQFDCWFRQSELYPRGVEDAFSRLKERGHVTTREGAEWFESTRFGDDQDRVLIRANGEPTYFLADLAYHTSKHDRGFQRVIDIWGPDHHGYIGRMQAAMEALGYGRDWLEILIVQQVNLLSGGKPAKMSKRLGEFITLEDLIEEVGKDSATFFFLMRRAESHLDFDIDLAKEESDENPVYYVKYAHARISGILRKAGEEGVSLDEPADLSLLVEDQEFALLKVLLQFPSLVAGAAREREPHRLTNYLREVSQAFHLFYHHCRVVGPEKDRTQARLALTRGTRWVLANGLGLMDIEAPERM